MVAKLVQSEEMIYISVDISVYSNLQLFISYHHQHHHGCDYITCAFKFMLKSPLKNHIRIKHNLKFVLWDILNKLNIPYIILIIFVCITFL